jgi:hypothetical protein
MDLKAVMKTGTSAQLAEAAAELERQEREAEGRRGEIETRRKACLLDDDHQGVDQAEQLLRQIERDLDGIGEKRKALIERRREVERLEAVAKLDALVKRGEALQATGLKLYAEYEEHCVSLRDSVLPGIDGTEREIRDINTALREAGDPRRVQSPVGVLFEKRGGDAGHNRLDVAKNTKLPAVIGAHHFWPRPV